MSIEEALAKLCSVIKPVTDIEVVATESALWRVSAASLTSPVAVPGFANSAMDGYAVRHADLSDAPCKLPILGESLAGHPFTTRLQPGSAVRIFTGAMLPPGADTVVMQEHTRADAEYVTLNASPMYGDYVRPIGHDLPKHAQLLVQGQRINPFLLAAATTSGISQIEVRRKPRVGVFATGDELQLPGERLAEANIYESNRIAIRSLLMALPLRLVDLGLLPDDLAATQQALARASQEFDVLITSGGVSVGDADYVRTALATLGTLDFWRLNLRPGKPFAFGRLPGAARPSHECLLFGLPGNPVSSIVTLLLLVKPALWHLAGASTHTHSAQRFLVPLAQHLSHTTGRNEYQRATLKMIDGELQAFTTSDQSSNRLQSFTDANCLILLPGDRASFQSGEKVQALPFDGLVS